MYRRTALQLAEYRIHENARLVVPTDIDFEFFPNFRFPRGCRCNSTILGDGKFFRPIGVGGGLQAIEDHITLL